jgi:hypothetical protein
MNDQEFRDKMIAGMARLEQNMTRLVGEDGEGGMIERVRDLENSRARDRGMAAGISLAVTVCWSAAKQFVFKG